MVYQGGEDGGGSRLYVGNLNWKIDEESLNGAFGGCVTHYKWITDRESGQFYGTCFVEVATPADAAACVALAGTKVMGRPVKVEYSPPRAGDVWPPRFAPPPSSPPLLSAALAASSPLSGL